MSQQTTKINLCSAVVALKWISVLPIVCACVCLYVRFLFSGCELPDWIPGMCNHRHPLHRSHAHRRVLLSVLSLLRQLRREDVPEADAVHPLFQENALLGLIYHHSHHPVSVSKPHGPVCLSGGLTPSSWCSIGNVIMFYGNQALKVNMEEGPLELNRTVNNIRSFLTAVPQVRVWSPPIDTVFPLNSVLRVIGAIE